MFQGQGMSVVCLGRCSWAKVSAALGAKQLMLPNFVTRTGGDFPQECLGKKKKVLPKTAALPQYPWPEQAGVRK